MPSRQKRTKIVISVPNVNVLENSNEMRFLIAKSDKNTKQKTVH